MARKRTIQSIEKDLLNAKIRRETLQAELDKAALNEENFLNELKAEQEKIHIQELNEIGGVVYKYFGEDISPEKFREMLDMIFTIDEVKSFVSSEISIAAVTEKEAC